MAESTKSYVVISNRYRPKSFDDLVGQEQVAQALKNAITTNRLNDRRSLLTGLDQLKRECDSSGLLEGIDAFNEAGGLLVIKGLREIRDAPELLVANIRQFLQANP